MRWKNPSKNAQDILITPFAVPVLIVVVPFLLLMLAMSVPFSRYFRWRQSLGWHKWFAWHPVYCGDFWDESLPRRWVWLETIYRHQYENHPCEYRWPEQVPQ